MKKSILYIITIVFLFSACKKEKIEPILPKPIKEIPKENPNIPIPPFSASIIDDGFGNRSINIIGFFKYIHFSSYNKIPCPPKNDCLNAVTHVYNLEFDKLVLDYKVPVKVYDLDYSFIRNGPYNYTFTHKMEKGRSYLVVLHGKEFLYDVIEYNY